MRITRRNIPPHGNDDLELLPWKWFLTIMFLLDASSVLCTGNVMLGGAISFTALLAIPTMSHVRQMLKLRRLVLGQRHWKVVRGIVKDTRDAATKWSTGIYHATPFTLEFYFMSIEYEVADMNGRIVPVRKELMETEIKQTTLQRVLFWLVTANCQIRPEIGSEIELLVLPGFPKSGIHRRRHLNERRSLLFQIFLGVIMSWFMSLCMASYFWLRALQEARTAVVLIHAALTGLLCLTCLISQYRVLWSINDETVLEMAKRDEGDAEILEVMDSRSAAMEVQVRSIQGSSLPCASVFGESSTKEELMRPLLRHDD